MKEEFEKMSNEVRSLKSEFAEFVLAKNEEIASLKDEVSGLKSRISKLENSVDDAEAYERRDTVIVSGNALPEFSQGEIPNEAVRKLFKDELRMEISKEEISTVHRLGPKPQNQAPDRRSFIVKFCRRDLKREIIMSSKKKSSPRIYVNESLTTARRQIFNTLRSIKRAHPAVLKGVTSFDGRIYAYTASNNGPNARDTRHLINDQDALVKFCTDYMKKPLDFFLSSFKN